MSVWDITGFPVEYHSWGTSYVIKEVYYPQTVLIKDATRQIKYFENKSYRYSKYKRLKLFTVKRS